MFCWWLHAQTQQIVLCSTPYVRVKHFTGVHKPQHPTLVCVQVHEYTSWNWPLGQLNRRTLVLLTYINPRQSPNSRWRHDLPCVAPSADGTATAAAAALPRGRDGLSQGLPNGPLQQAEALQVSLPQRRRSLLVFLGGFFRGAARRLRLGQPPLHVLQLRPVLRLDLLLRQWSGRRADGK